MNKLLFCNIKKSVILNIVGGIMKKGFTLIELLAVIVILAIIALISTPLVFRYINNSRLRSFEISIHNVDSAVDYYMVTKKLKEETIGNPEIIDVKDLSLDDKNSLSGSVTIYDTDGEYSISYNNVTDGNYVIKGDNKNKEIISINSISQPILLANNDKIIIDSYKYCIYGLADVSNFETLFKVIGGDIEFVKSSQGFYGTGAKVNVKKDGQIVETYSVVIFGDMNGDSVTDGFDAAIMDLALNNHTQLTASQQLAADVNRNGKLDKEDYDLVTKISVGLCSVDQHTGKNNC